MKKNFWKKLKSPILALAPMAGITDSAFRQMCRKHGADVVYSEMASATALFYNPEKTLELIKFKKTERPYVVQLFGNKPEHFGHATRIITEQLESNPPATLRKRAYPRSDAGGPDGIDINFGCPARKVFSIGSGCALMQDKKKARQIIEEVLKNTNLPVSIKIRAGIKEHSALDFVKHIQDLPFQAIMVHGRTYEGSFAGSVDFKIIEKIKKIAPEKIVLANGGIMTPEDAEKVLKKYPTIDGLGIARGAWGKPFIFSQIKDQLKKGKFKEYDFEKIKPVILEHAKLVYKDKKDLGIKELRKHLAWYVKGFPGASEIRQRLVRVETIKEIEDILSRY